MQLGNRQGGGVCYMMVQFSSLACCRVGLAALLFLFPRRLSSVNRAIARLLP